MTSARRQSSSLGGDKGEIDNTRLDRKHRKGRTMSGQSRRNLGPSPVGATLDKNRRGLCEGVNNHCFNPEEKNVFSPPSAQITIAPTMAPSISPQPTSFRTDPTGCESDEQGNYGVIDGPSFRTVSYRYQVETTPELSSAVMLNVEVLQDVEKAISDLMVQRFFAEECSPPTISIESPNNTNQQQQQLVIAKVQGDISMGRESDRGGIRKLLARNMKSEVHEELVGLSAEPPDQVLEGDEGGKWTKCQYWATVLVFP